MYFKRRFSSGRALILLAAGMAGLFLWPRGGLAVVGKAEEPDQVDWQNLKDFEDKLKSEENQRMLDMGMGEKITDLTAKKESAETAEERAAYQAELDHIKSQLLMIPKIDRFRYELNGDVRYETNSNRENPGQGEKNDTVLNTNDTFLIDLSGRKTDLRLETNGAKMWSIEFPASKDMWKIEERLRYRRKYFRRISHSVNSRFARTDNKTIEINNNRIRWDGEQQQSFNYLFSRKLSINLDLDYLTRYFSQKAYKKDSATQITVSPSAFWNLTPKSRVSLGYSLGINDARMKTNCTTSNNVTVNYFGKVTRKSSASLNAAYTRQVGLKKDNTINTFTIGAGYVWQATTKSQIAVQVLRSMQNTTSNLDQGESVNNVDATTRQDNYYTNNSISVSLNSRLTSKINASLTSNMSYTYNKTSQDQQAALDAADANVEITQWTFPINATINYLITRWMTLTLTYEFTERVGNKRKDTMRNHSYFAALRFVF